MTKRKRQETIQWPKEKDRRQYNDQKKKTEDTVFFQGVVAGKVVEC